MASEFLLFRLKLTKEGGALFLEDSASRVNYSTTSIQSNEFRFVFIRQKESELFCTEFLCDFWDFRSLARRLVGWQDASCSASILCVCVCVCARVLSQSPIR